MSPSGNMRTVIFDLDGTLADTSGDLLAAANVALGEMGHDVRLDPGAALDCATAMRGGRAMLTLALGRAGLATEAEITRGYPILLAAYGAAISHHTFLFPRAMETVEILKTRGHPVGICTNKPEGLARQLLSDLGVLDAFHSLIGADTLPVRKPDPLPLSEATRLAGGDPAHTCLIGDTVTDRETARAAGCPSVLVTFGPHGRGVADLSPEALLDDFADLPDLIAGL